MYDRRDTRKYGQGMYKMMFYSLLLRVVHAEFDA